MGEQVNRQIGSIVQSAETVRQLELERARVALADLPDEHWETVEAMSRAIVKKILHQPLRQVRSWAEDGDIAQASSVFTAFGSEDEPDA